MSKMYVKRVGMVISAIGMLTIATSTFAGLTIKGDVEQKYEARNSPQTALGIGAGAKAKAEANVIDGDAHIDGSVRQTYTASNSPQTALAIGAGAYAQVSANRISGN